MATNHPGLHSTVESGAGGATKPRPGTEVVCIDADQARSCGSGGIQSPFVVLDTCVLISNVLRHILLGMAEAGRLLPVWSTVIGDEWRRTASRIWNVPLGDLEEQWAQLQREFPLADQGVVESYKTGLRFSDAKDWHVIAAGRAVLAGNPGASVAIATRNVRDFNRAELRKVGLGLLDPDRLLVDCWPTDRELLLDLVYGICGEAADQKGAVEAMLKRERLFRFNKLVMAGR